MALSDDITSSDAPRKRVRVEDNITSTRAEALRLDWTCTPRSSTWNHSGYYIPVLNGTKRSMVDYIVPRFSSRKAAGERFFNDMFKEEITVSSNGVGRQTQRVAAICSSPDAYALWNSNGCTVFNYIPLDALSTSKGNRLPLISTSLSEGEILRLKKLVSTEVLAKRGQATPDLWESAAEYRRTIAMLQAPLDRLKSLTQRALSSAEKSQLSRRLLKEVSDGYLMERYGISPLLRDIKQILSSLDKTLGDKEVTSRASEQLASSSLLSGTSNDGDGITTWKNQVQDVVTVRGMSLDRGHVSIANSLGFSSKGLMLLPVQLTSYSFVADWVVNLSSYIGSTLPVFGWNPLGSCLVTTRVTSNAYGIVSDVAAGPTYKINRPVTGSVGIIRVTTTREALLPGSFEIKSDFKFDEFKRVADAIALVSQRFVKLGNLVGYRPNNSAFHDRKAYHRWEENLNASRSFT